ncbi:MAG: MBL fold metallo-hydrolase [Myxococcales bacterium]|nr:MBL fold metallo-hydrolase [Myxococcales bacterium]
MHDPERKSRWLIEVEAGPYRVRGVSLGGVYTSLHVPELGVVLDAGIPVRAFAATDHLFLSHAHGDHVGALPALLGIRGLLHAKRPPRVYLPAPIVSTLEDALASLSALQRYDLSIDPVPMSPGDEAQLRQDLYVRAFRTHHPVPSLGYLFFDRVQKLRAEHRGLPGAEIARRKAAGEPLFDVQERPLLAYATDTLLRVVETAPEITRAKVLILECTFLDERKSLEASRAGCHVHLDELVAVVERLENEHVVLMHFSQIYSPREVHQILEARLRPLLGERLVVFAPTKGGWPGG